jgi:hypothetical protein
MKIDEIVWLKKERGFSVAVRAAEQKELVLLSQEGDLPGLLWRQNFCR